MNKPERVLNVEFKVTNACNFRCTYCFEHGSFGTKKVPHEEICKMLDRIELLRNSEEFKNRYDRMTFTLWGGEPTLNKQSCIEILEHAKRLGTQVQMYTNGTGLRGLQEYIRSGILNVQISYDGEPVNSMNRLDSDKKPTTEFVRKQIDFMIENDLPFSLKSTISPSNFNHMPDCWRDIFDIRQRCKSHKQRVNYCPTIDFYNIEGNYEDDLKKYMLEMAKLEKKNFMANGGKFLLTWFNGSGDSYCSAGVNMLTLDLDGAIYPCHGCLYAKDENKQELRWCSIYDPDFINTIVGKIDLHTKVMYNVPDECTNEFFTYNVRCNSESFNQSDKPTYGEKWTDYTNYKPLDKYFRVISKVTLALKNIMENPDANK